MPDLVWPKQRKLYRAPQIGFNAEVYRHFQDEDLTEGRINVRNLCLIGAKDSRGVAESKIKFFREQVQKVHLKPTIVGIPKASHDESVTYKCQIQLYFRQDIAATPSGKTPVDAQISFRLRETHETITESEYKRLASRIEVEFAANRGYRWDKGRILCLYTDSQRGYELQIYARSSEEGERVAKKVLDIQGHTFEDDLYRFTEPKKRSIENPGKTTILKKPRSKPRWRPTATVRFLYADLIIWNSEPITLVDRTGLKVDPVILAP